MALNVGSLNISEFSTKDAKKFISLLKTLGDRAMGITTHCKYKSNIVVGKDAAIIIDSNSDPAKLFEEHEDDLPAILRKYAILPFYTSLTEYNMYDQYFSNICENKNLLTKSFDKLASTFLYYLIIIHPSHFIVA